MRPVDPALQARLDAEVTSLALCLRLTRTDGVRLGYCLHDTPLWIDGLLYRPQEGSAPSAVEQGVDGAVGSVSLGGLVALEGMARRDLAAGRYDGAEVSLFLADWQQPALSPIPLFAGAIGDLRLVGGAFEADVRGPERHLRRRLGGAFSPECRAQLGDHACKVNLAHHSHAARIDAQPAPDRVTLDLALGDGLLSGGRLRFWSGANAGLDVEILDQAGADLTLFQPLPGAAASGDRVEAVEGCDKRLTTCRDRFANVVNFRGEPFLPGNDAVLTYPDAR